MGSAKTFHSIQSKGASLMKNITVSIDENVYRRARVWAAKNDTSISATVQDLLLNLEGLSRVARTFTAGLPRCSACEKRDA